MAATPKPDTADRDESPDSPATESPFAVPAFEEIEKGLSRPSQRERES
jgi:hypothetical protein